MLVMGENSQTFMVGLGYEPIFICVLHLVSVSAPLAVDHWYRFLKQRLHWTLPHLPN